MDPPTPRRTIVTTVVGAAAILLGGAGSLLSLFALLLAIGKPYASSSTDFLGIFLIFILPPGTLLAGIGLMFYEELHGGTWQRYPEWARQRRDEIIVRVKSRFREPDYEYQETVSVPPPASPKPPLPKRDGSILPVLLALLLIAAGAFWLAARGLESGETRLPLKHNHSSRSVSRDEKPALFWTSISLISVLGTASTVSAAWFVIGHLRRR